MRQYEEQIKLLKEQLQGGGNGAIVYKEIEGKRGKIKELDEESDSDENSNKKHKLFKKFVNSLII